MTPVRVGAVGYLNARPLVHNLDRDPRFAIRYDVPSECARLLHAHEIDIGLVPSIEYLRGPQPYGIVPGPAVVSNGPVASVAIFTRRDPGDIQSIAMDATSRTSVALATVLLRRVYNVAPVAKPMAPALDSMLEQADAALVIGDYALTVDYGALGATKIDLGHLWTMTTGLPFVYACWTGWPNAVTPDDVARLQQARDSGVSALDEIAHEYFQPDPLRQAVATRYLRDNIQYYLGATEYEGLTTFFRYASELGLVEFDGELRIYHAEHSGAD